MPIVLMVAVFYFLLLAPQQRRQKKWQAMVSELKSGDKVITNGGIRGTIISIKEDAGFRRITCGWKWRAAALPAWPSRKRPHKIWFT